MTTAIEDLIASLITKDLSEELRGQLIGVDALPSGAVAASDFHSLQTWRSGDARYYLIHNDISAILFRNETLAGVAKFDRKLLSKKNPAKHFAKPFASLLAEGAL